MRHMTCMISDRITRASHTAWFHWAHKNLAERLEKLHLVSEHLEFGQLQHARAVRVRRCKDATQLFRLWQRNAVSSVAGCARDNRNLWGLCWRAPSVVPKAACSSAREMPPELSASYAAKSRATSAR